MTAGLAGFTLLILSIILGRVAVELRTLHEKWGAARKAELASHLDDLDRSKLLEVYSRAKKTLETLQRPIAFLSMDIVDSTGLKHGEDPSVAERDFRQYKHMVETVFAANGAIKSTWTPDGVMAAFADAPAAIQAGAATILELQTFNAKVKTLRREFKLRVGVNAGTVLFDERTPLEEMSDRVIDVAGHMQKHGSINMVCAPTEVAAACAGKFAFKPAGRRIDGFDVSEWDPLAAPASA
jgi:class 3 adenylate cyclase